MGAFWYRGFAVLPCEPVQLGYHLGDAVARSRKLGRQYVISLDDDGTKTVDTAQDARNYIDAYLGPDCPDCGEAPEDEHNQFCPFAPAERWRPSCTRGIAFVFHVSNLARKHLTAR